MSLVVGDTIAFCNKIGKPFEVVINKLVKTV